MVFGELCLVLQHQAGGRSCWAKGCSHIIIQRVLKPQAKQKPATDLNFARCLSLIREKEGKIIFHNEKASRFPSTLGWKGYVSAFALDIAQSCQVLPKPKWTSLQIMAGTFLWIFFFFFHSCCIFQASKNWLLPPLQSWHFARHNFLTRIYWKHTQPLTWDREVAARSFQHFYSKSILLLCADSGQSTRAALGTPFPSPTLCSQTLVEHGCFLANALGIFLERS